MVQVRAEAIDFIANHSSRRLLGVTRLVAVWQCPNPEWLTFATKVHWNQALNPIALLAYFVFVTVQYSVTRHGISKRAGIGAANDDMSSVHEEVGGINWLREAGLPVGNNITCLRASFDNVQIASRGT